MKRRTLAIILLCIGIVGLLLPWNYTLVETDTYRIDQTVTGGKVFCYDYEELRKIPSCVGGYGTTVRSIEELIHKALSGAFDDNDRLRGLCGSEKIFDGFDQLYMPRLPKEFSVWRMEWSVYGMEFYLATEEGKQTNLYIGYCTPDKCRICRTNEENWEKYQDDKNRECYRLLDGTKVIELRGKDGRSSIKLWGKDNGVNFHAWFICPQEKASRSYVNSFGMRPYFSTHPKMLMIYAIDIGHWMGAIAATIGIALLEPKCLFRKKKSAATE